MILFGPLTRSGSKSTAYAQGNGNSDLRCRGIGQFDQQVLKQANWMIGDMCLCFCQMTSEKGF